jgi:DNA replication initiation complex subunit (GINS family)
MDLKKDYNTLYQHWLKEFEQADLTSLTQDDFNKYKNVLASINTFQVDKADKIKHQLSESYKNVVEAEKLLYQNLISTFKGYKKVKNLLLIEGQYSLDQEITVKEEQAILTEDSELEKAKEIGLKDKEQLLEEKIKEEIDYNYTLIRFLKKTPPLVGIDLLNYGPFEENDIANLPYKNALILINEKFAQQIDIH